MGFLERWRQSNRVGPLELTFSEYGALRFAAKQAAESPTGIGFLPGVVSRKSLARLHALGLVEARPPGVLGGDWTARITTAGQSYADQNYFDE